MQIKKVIGKIFPVIDSDLRKQRVYEACMDAEQYNHDTVNIHRFDKNNVGDYYCAPHHYFEELKGKFLDISGFRSASKKISNHWIDTASNNGLIIGGGGLLNLRHFEMQMQLFEELNKKGKKTILWGPGHNDTNKNNFGKAITYNVNLKNFGLVGVRDYSYKNHWVPCVSCLHSIFDDPYTETREVGILFGKKSSKNKELANQLKAFDSTSNTTNLDEMVKFIGSSETVVTDSYHAMYWAILLGKKVVAVPTTTKFFDFKYKCVISSYENFQLDLKKAKSYSGVLEECREINYKFADKVFDYLNF